MKNINNNNGITLIALVITIIILLILAGISIATLTGENGILTKASVAEEETKIKNYQEQLEIIWQGVSIESIENNLQQEEKLKKCKEKIEIDNNFENSVVDIVDNIIEVITEDGYIFHIIDGKVVYARKQGEKLKDISVSLTQGELNNKKVILNAVASETLGRKLIYIVYIDGKEIARQTTYNDTFTYEYTTSFGKVQSYIEIKYENDKVSKSNVITIEDNTIESKKELESFRNKANAGDNYKGKTIQLINDIDLQGSNSSQWIPINNFSGTFDGNYHLIKNLYAKSNAYNALALFGNITSEAIIQNTILENVMIENNINNATQHSHAAGIAAIAFGKIINCGINSGRIALYKTANNVGTNWKTTFVGGVCSQGFNEIRNCYNKAIIIGENVNENYNSSLVGGIAGTVQNAKVLNCYNHGSVSAKGGVVYIGGISGEGYTNTTTKLQISNSYNIGTVTANGNSTRIGGIVGQNGRRADLLAGAISNCYCTTTTTYSYYYWNGSNDNSTSTTGRISADTLKNYANVLGESFENDTTNSNNGYPILKWQKR